MNESAYPIQVAHPRFSFDPPVLFQLAAANSCLSSGRLPPPGLKRFQLYRSRGFCPQTYLQFQLARAVAPQTPAILAGGGYRPPEASSVSAARATAAWIPFQLAHRSLRPYPLPPAGGSPPRPLPFQVAGATERFVFPTAVSFQVGSPAILDWLTQSGQS